MKSGSLKVFVPARFGSKRVKAKSLRLLNGKPLIEYILASLKQTKHMQDIYINSDSDLFGEIAKQNNLKFYKRKPELATSQAKYDDYVYDFMINEPSDYLAVVNPTSPFISAKELDDAWEYFANNNFDTLLSCDKIQTHCFYRGETVNFSRVQKHPRSQDLDPVLELNFAVNIWDCKKYKSNYENFGWGIYTGNLGFYYTEGYANIDIDYEEDFVFAEFVARFLADKTEVKAEYADIMKEYIDNNIDTSN